MRRTRNARFATVFGIICVVLTTNPLARTAKTEEAILAPIPGKVTMVDLGAKKCIPCKMMAPILEALDKEYRDRAAIVFIDVSANPEAAKKFAIQVIPTQIFFDTEGREMLRHQGFMAKEAIIAELVKLGVK
jgi:thioredoxin 1